MKRLNSRKRHISANIIGSNIGDEKWDKERPKSLLDNREGLEKGSAFISSSGLAEGQAGTILSSTVSGASMGGPVGAGVGLVTGVFSSEMARKKQKAQQQAAMNAMWGQRTNQDRIIAEDYKNTVGQDTVEYYAKGGLIDKSALLEDSSIGKFQTTGGKLKPLAEGVQEVVGNEHGEKTIDNSYGVTLSENGQPVAEVEDGEVIADGQAVFSNRLMADNKNTYADKMKKVTSKRNTLEKRLDGKLTTVSKNTVERQLAGLNMAEESLFKQQELHKEIEGMQVLDKLALGGPIRKNTDPYGFRKTYEEQLFPSTTYNPNENTLATESQPIVAPLPTIIPDVLPKEVSPYDANSDKGGDFLRLGIDNIGNAIINAASPRVPKPILNSPVRLNTRVNVNPQVAAVKNAVEATANNVMSNTSNSNIARANIAATRLRGSQQLSDVYANQNNIQTQLENRNKEYQNRNETQNNNIFSDYQDRVQANTAGRLARTSANINNFAEDISQMGQKSAILTQDDNELLTELQNDITGQKKREYRLNPYIRQRAKNNPLLKSLIGI